MSRPFRFGVHVLAVLLAFVLAAGLQAIDPLEPLVWLGGLLVGTYSAALEDGARLPRLVWQSPALFRNAGLFLKWGDRRWRLVRVTRR